MRESLRESRRRWFYAPVFFFINNEF
jgi:hypothetical protein